MDHTILDADPSAVLTKATLRASELLGLGPKGLANVMGMNERSIAQMLSGEKTLKPQSKKGELALMLIRLSAALEACVGAKADQRLAWMTTHHQALGGQPMQLVQSIEGLVSTVNYLEGLQ